MKRILSAFAAAMLSISLLAGCGTTSGQQQNAGVSEKNLTEQVQTTGYEDGVSVRIASLSGPTTMGLAQLMKGNEAAAEHYVFNDPYTSADEIVPLIVKGEVDVALVPANLASTLYQKTDGGVQAAYINTLGVLDVVASKEETLTSYADLVGKTVFLPGSGKGATPEAAARFLAEKSGIGADGLTLDFSNPEATGVVAALSANSTAIAILPQPFATVAVTQNDKLEIKFSLTNAWNQFAEDDSQLLTGVTLVRKEFAEQHPAAVRQFLVDAADSVDYVNNHAEESSAWIEQLGIVKAPIAQKAIPRCNLVCITGNEMKATLSAYLQTLSEFDAKLVGGTLPDEAFYFIP